MHILLSTCTYMMTWRMLRGLSLSLSLYITHIIHSYLNPERHHLLLEYITWQCMASLAAAGAWQLLSWLWRAMWEKNMWVMWQSLVDIPREVETFCIRLCCALDSVVRVLVDSGNLQTALRMVLRPVDKLGPCEEQLWIHVEGAPSKPRSVRCSGCSPVVADNLKCFTSWSQQREWTVPRTRPGVYEMLF